jgi:hypothetical protein
MNSLEKSLSEIFIAQKGKFQFFLLFYSSSKNEKRTQNSEILHIWKVKNVKSRPWSNYCLGNNKFA